MQPALLAVHVPATHGNHRLPVAFLHKSQETHIQIAARAQKSQLIYFLHGDEAIFSNEFISHFPGSSIVYVLTTGTAV